MKNLILTILVLSFCSLPSFAQPEKQLPRKISFSNSLENLTSTQEQINKLWDTKPAAFPVLQEKLKDSERIADPAESILDIKITTKLYDGLFPETKHISFIAVRADLDEDGVIFPQEVVRSVYEFNASQDFYTTADLIMHFNNGDTLNKHYEEVRNGVAFNFNYLVGEIKKKVPPVKTGYFPDRSTILEKTNGKLTLFVRENGKTKAISGLSFEKADNDETFYLKGMKQQLLKGSPVFYNNILIGIVLNGNGTPLLDFGISSIDRPIIGIIKSGDIAL